MSEATPHFAPVVALLFLGTVLLIGLSILVLLYGAVRRSALLAGVSGGVAVLILVTYGALLLGCSLFSSEIVLRPGAWKYFCEIDCHLGYSIAGV